MTFRNKPSNYSQVFQTKQINSSLEDSRVDSTNSKRFTRKKQSPHQSNRNSKNHKDTEAPIPRTIQKSPSYGLIKPRIRLSDNVIRTQDLFLKMGSTPNKIKMVGSKANTDRTETTVLQQYGDNESNTFVFNKQTTKKFAANDFQSEIQIKNNELMIFEDQNNRLKKDLQVKQELFLKEIKQKETEYNQSIRQLQQQIKTLKEELQDKNDDLKSKNEEIKTLKKNQQQLTRDIKSLRYDKLMIQKQMEDLYKKKLSKETRQLMSFRQMSLMKQLDELKDRMGQSKTHLEEQMEEEISKLRENVIITDKKNQSLQILGLILHRKVQQTEKERKQQTENFSRSYSQLIQSNRELADQLNKAKKQILKLRQLNLNKSVAGPRKRNVFVSSQLSDSLSFSFSN